MKLVIQRVKHASVEVEKNIVGKIEKGFLVLIGIKSGDTKEQADYLVKLLDSKIMTANEVRRKLNMRPLEETELPADSDIILGEPLNENSDEGIKDGLSISETDANNIEV